MTPAEDRVNRMLRRESGAAVTPEEIRAVQRRIDAVNKMLRRESGAAVTQAEFERAHQGLPNPTMPTMAQSPYRGPTTAEAERAMLETQMAGEGSLADRMATAFAQDNRFVGQNHNQGAYLPTIARWNANRRADERAANMPQPSLAEQLRFLLGVMGGR